MRPARCAAMLLLLVLAGAVAPAGAAARPAAGGHPAYSTFLGGPSFDDVLAVATDSSGHLYLTGRTSSGSFPTTARAFDTTFNGGFDAYVAKLSRDGSRLIWSTFLGGDSTDEPSGIAIGPRGEVHVSGSTASDDFPATPGAFDTDHDVVHDGFAATLSPDGSRLLHSTFLGGSSFDFATGIALDPRGDMYVAGYTESPDFPTTPGTLDRERAGPADAFVVKLDGRAATLGYATLVGGAGEDVSFGIAVDPRGRAHATGYTDSADFPTTAGAFDPTYGGAVDAFALSLLPDGSALGYSTFLGGAENDIGTAIALRPNGEAHVAGRTSSPGFPTTPGAFDRSSGGGFSDAFVSSLARDGSALGFSTFLGGSFEDSATAIAVDPSGRPYVTGLTQSPEFPVTPGAFDGTLDFIDAFVTVFEPGGSRVAYSTYLGGRGFDQGHGIAARPSGHAYAAGDTRSADFPTTANAFDATYNGGFDGFATKLPTR